MQVTGEMVMAAFRIATLAVDYARELAKAKGMNDAEIEAAWRHAKESNAQTLDDYIRAFGGTPPAPPADPAPPPVEPPAPEPEPTPTPEPIPPPVADGAPPWFDFMNVAGTSWPSILEIPRHRFPVGASIYVTGPLFVTGPQFYFVPRSILHTSFAQLDPRPAGLI